MIHSDPWDPLWMIMPFSRESICQKAVLLDVLICYLKCYLLRSRLSVQHNYPWQFPPLRSEPPENSGLTPKHPCKAQICFCVEDCLLYFLYVQVCRSMCVYNILIIQPSIHFLLLFQGQAAVAAVWAGKLRLPSPRTLPLTPLGGSQSVPWPAEWQSHSSVSWVFLGVSSQRGMQGTPPEEGVQGASDTDARATSAGSSLCGGEAALLHTPPRWQSSAPYF